MVGSWNDGEISRGLQEKLCNPERNLPGYGVMADSAFPVANEMFQRIISPLKEGELELQPVELQGQILLLSSAITSLRQPAEWSMGAAEKVYRRLLLRLPYNSRTRHL